ncbi:hypothetical protein [Gottfriedia solisilvae]|uniref:Uncharacterized protein n=1 Tax=Gottfriedia solisilvae TaxID=1516104 RepID=A0A8J3AGN7_9BACI|nr:hypothetical protein [Gottfriedia solisilvae]GGI13499.1 hypothetical protein GCM10007380_18220 [Gottfriedia solisilvae]
MDQLKSYYWTIFEVFLALLIGSITTNIIIRQLYAINDVQFLGNISVIWFSVSFMIFGLESLIRLLIWKNSEQLKKRIRGYFFWAVFFISIIILIIPILKGEIPY